MAATAAVAVVATGFISAYGIRQQGKYQKSVLEQNARMSEEAAQDAIERGKTDEWKKRLEVKQIIGSQRVSMAAQGIEINDADDSAGAVQLSTAALGELDALTVRNNAAREAWGYRVQGANYMAQAQLADMASKNAARDTILTSGINAFGIYSMGGGGRGATAPRSSGQFGLGGGV